MRPFTMGTLTLLTNIMKELWSPKHQGSLYFHGQVGLEMLRARGKEGLIPIVAVFDIALDPSGPARYGSVGIIYLWTRKSDGMQYVGSTSNARNCFGKRYNSPASLSQDISYFNHHLVQDTPSNYYLTVLAITDKNPMFRYPLETLWINVLNAMFNINLIAGSNKLQRVNQWTIDTAFRVSSKQAARIAKYGNPLACHLGKSKPGAENPFFGKTHSILTKDLMSAPLKGGTHLYIYELVASQWILLAEVSSQNRASEVLRKQGVSISRPTITKFTERHDSNLENYIYQCKHTNRQFLFTTLRRHNFIGFR